MPTFVLHSTLIDADVGSIVRWTVADAAELAALVPTTPDLGRVAWQLDTDQIFLLASLVPKWIDLSGIGAGAAVWGAITGTLSLQTDLQAELDVKKPIEISGAGAPGVSTGNGLALGTLYVDTAGNQSYVLVDATTDANVWSSSSGGFANAPDAALFTERADHVNTPTATKGELWLKTDSPHNLVLTDGDDNDRLIVTMDEASGSTVANAVPKFDSVGQIEDITTLTYSTGELKNSNNVASFSAKERTSGPSGTAAYGKLWVRDDAPTALMFTDDAGGEHLISGETMWYPVTFRLPTTPVTATWYSTDDMSMTAPSPWADTFGTGATPSSVSYKSGFPAPFDGVATEVQCWFRGNTVGDLGDLWLFKIPYTDGGISPALVAVGTGIPLVGTGSSKSDDCSVTWSSSNTFSKGDLLSFYYVDDAGVPAANAGYVRVNLKLEETY